MIKRNKKLTIINIILLLACLAAVGGLLTALLRQNSKTNTKTANSVTTVSQDKVQQAVQKVKWTKQNEPVQLPILMYHAIHDMAPDEAANANLIVSPAVFESHIKRLSEEGYYFLTPEEAYRALSQNALPAKKVIWLTFDDSLIDFYTIAYPILKKYQAKATNNVITAFTDEGRAGNLTVKQMKEMKANGMSFQSHTVNHPDLSTLDQETQAKELSQSKEYLDRQLNQTTTAIAYPAGRYNDTTLSLANNQYKLGVTTNEGLASAENGLLSLNRVRILPDTSADILMNTISPALP
ncbi:polysaccharide deacetylase family protein [Streptococcus caviae]|uniref:polysaccharide deacetylase family protein n=1 Tax=Streptococcus sp. 'caviae' TaxID=1915004 RepID=UPI00094B81C0|nr:polysaccharide deacetylase family protein [Streptococcus sp. 'caviae']OLN83921.1 deacetylase [Streptococcus sp. 'caviae']